MELYEMLLVASIFTTGLAAGVFFTFTTLIIPGLMDASPRDSLRGFQTIDRRLQRTSPSRDWQPLFGLIVFGTALLLVIAAIVGWSHFSGAARISMLIAVLGYNLGFWGPTLGTILPFNNRVRDYDLDAMGDDEIAAARREFERNWTGWPQLIRAFSSAAAFGSLLAVAVVTL